MSSHKRALEAMKGSGMTPPTQLIGFEQSLEMIAKAFRDLQHAIDLSTR